MERTQGQDLYEVLQVSPRAHPLIITKAFRLLAAVYHPDNTQTGNEETFKQLTHAYHILSDPVRRAAYDRECHGVADAHPAPAWADDSEAPQLAERPAWDEQELRPLLLRALYDVRRGRPYKPGLSLLVLSELFGCPIESLQYTLWYLRGKRFIDTTDDSDVMITVDGVDYLEASGFSGNGQQSSERITVPIPLPSPDDVTRGSALIQRAKGNGSNH
jgi:hypothetical protein